MKNVNRDKIKTKLLCRNAIEVENRRHALAKNNQLPQLISTYKNNLPEIPDFNKSTLWNKLNNRSFVDKSNNPIAWDRLNKVLTSSKFSNKKILDIGFGAGDLEKLIHSKYIEANLFGIDISDHSVKRANDIFPGWKFIVGSVEKLPFSNECFDIVTTLEVLEHIRPRKIFNVLSEIHRVLKRKGKFILSVPINENLDRLLSKGLNPNAHVRIYTDKLICAELEIAGFKIEKIHKLFAFKNMYRIKTLLCSLVPMIKHSNNLVIIASKP